MNTGEQIVDNQLTLISGDYVIVNKELWAGRLEETLMIYSPEKLVEVMTFTDYKLNERESIIRKASSVELRVFRARLLKDRNNHTQEIATIDGVLSFVGEV